MDWNDLRYFHAIARAGSLAGAARELGVEHTTVSRRLGALEAALEARLFTRGPAGLTLTEVGAEVLPCVEAIAAQVEALTRRAAGGDGRVEGTVRLTIPEAGDAYVMRHLASLRERHPALVVEVLGDRRALDLRRGEAEVAVRFAPSADPELLQRRVGSAGWSLYASADYLARAGPLASPEAPGAHRFVGFDAGLASIEGAAWLAAHVPPAQVVVRSNSVGAAAAAAAAGLGIAPLPCFVAASGEGLVRVAPGLVGSTAIYLVTHPDVARAARVRAVLDSLVELFRRDAALWSGAPDP